MFKQIQALIIKDFRIELRQRYALNSVLLYLLSAILLTYLALQSSLNIDSKYLGVIFWIILTFSSVNAVSKSFIQETESRRNYFYSLARANAVLISKMLYNSLLILCMSVISFGLFALFLSFTPSQITIFLGGLILGSIGYASVLTMTSAIAAKTNANFALVAILSFPLILPLFILLIRITDISAMSVVSGDALRFLLILFLLDVVVWILSILLFPYVWRD
jgi:heme exporter protein B